MKKIFILFITILMFVLTGCRYDVSYKGQYKELYTTAIYSIPNAVGFMDHGEGTYDADIYIWEQDDYGRTLFAYCEDYSNHIFALVASQCYDENNVYFYPDVNYALTMIESKYKYEGVDDEHLKDRTKEFYENNKEHLKEKNDWNKPLDKNKCISYKITDHKGFDEDVFTFSEEEGNEILNEYTSTLNFVNPSARPYRYSSILQMDSEGKILHEIYGIHSNYDKTDDKWWNHNGEENTYYYIVLWVITDKDGNYDKETGVFAVFSKANTSAEFIYNTSDILEFKNRNGWTNSYCND